MTPYTPLLLSAFAASDPLPAGKGGDQGNPLISLVIPAFNEEKFIRKTIESVVRSGALYPGPIEIIVVDNNSTDATARIARKSGARVVFESKNQIARARNAGAKAAQGKFLVFLDADTPIEGDILNKVARHLSTGAVIGGGAWVVPDSGWFGRLVFELINISLSFRNITIGPFMYCLREDFEKVGGFDEAYYAAEEFSLAKRMKKEGKCQNKKWKIIKYSKSHKLITSNRKFQRFGGLEMASQNAHLVWNTHQKLKQKSQCRFWYQIKR